MLKITLKQLELFVSVVESGSFTLAAERQFVTQSTVSIHIAALENALGTPVFTRENHKRITLTPAGRTAYTYAREIVTRCREMEQCVAQQERGKLRIGASSVPSQWLVPNMMAGFTARHSDCSFELRKGDNYAIHSLLRRRVIRMGFVGAALDRVEMDYIPLVRDPVIMVTPNTPEYRELKDNGVSGDSLLHKPLILREKDSGIRIEFERYLLTNGIPLTSCTVAAEIDQPSALLEAVSGGMGISPTTMMTAKKELMEGRLLAFSLGDGLYRDLYLATRKDFTPDRIEEDFIRFIRDSAGRVLQM